jgi:hypothetical protein
MATPAPHQAATDIPAQVFEKFLGTLAATDTPQDVVSRLRKTLLEDKSFTERALREAVFGEEAQP